MSAESRTPGAPTRPHTMVLLAAFVVILWGIAEARSFLIPICFSALLAFLTAPLLRFMRRFRMPEGISVGVGAAVLIIPIVGLLYALVHEGEALARDWPNLLASAKKGFASLQESSLAQKLHLSQYLDTAELSDRLGADAGAGFRIFVEGLKDLLSVGSHLVLVVFFAVVMLASRLELRRGLEAVLAQGQSLRAAETLDRVSELIERFLIARLGIAALVAVVDLVILKAFGLDYVLLMSAFLGLMTLVPVVGFIAGIIPPVAAAIAASHGGGYIFGLFLALGTVNSLQDHLLTPKLIGQRLNLNFLMTYLAIFGGERLWGPAGMFLSIPILGVLRIALSSVSSTQAWGNLLAERREVRKRR